MNQTKKRQKAKRVIEILTFALSLALMYFVQLFGILSLEKSVAANGTLGSVGTTIREPPNIEKNGKKSAPIPFKAEKIAADTSESCEKSDNEQKSANTLSDISENPRSFPTASGISINKKIRLYDSASDTVSEKELDDYVLGVLLAEMPYTFHSEALRAQAVASRTYTVYSLLNGSRHEKNADLCTSPSHCQGYVDPKTVSEERLSAALSAVDDTRDLILCHDGEPILAVYHAASGAQTCSSAEIWGGELSYLTSVESFECQNSTLSASETKTFSDEKFLSALSALCKNPPSTLDEAEKSLSFSLGESGRVNRITVKNFGNRSEKNSPSEISEEEISVDAFLKAFGLRSRDFSLSYTENEVTVTSYGFGHGVGLSQLGAEDLAQKGYNFEEILLHYYSGTSLALLKK